MAGAADRAVVSERAAGLFRDTFQADPDVVVAAPGRINIIGEHTDYAGGLCLPAAVDRFVAVAVGDAPGLEMVSDAFPGTVTLAEPPPAPTGGWADVPLGVVLAMRPLGARLAFASTVPSGAGLSSSAATAVATAVALLGLDGRAMAPMDVARACRSAENVFLGVPSGLMDQVASLMGRRDRALYFNAGAELVETVELPPSFAWLVIESGISRDLRASDYGDRPAEAAEALRLAREKLPGLRGLADLDPGQLASLYLPEVLNRRARHVLSEVQRVRLAVACLEAGRIEALGELLVTSHRSLARDCEVSLPELDRLVEVALEAGCAGARLLGAGFGGSVLALVEASEADAVADAIRASDRPGGRKAPVHRVHPVDGAVSPA